MRKEDTLVVCLIIMALIVLAISIVHLIDYINIEREKIQQEQEKINIVHIPKIIHLRVVFTYANGNWTNVTMYGNKEDIKNSF